MLYLYAALAEEERWLTHQSRTGGKEGGWSKPLQSAQPGSCRLAWSSCAGSAADEFASSLIPVLQAIRATGVVTLASVAAELNRRGIRSARGGKWHRSSAANLLYRTKLQS